MFPQHCRTVCILTPGNVGDLCIHSGQQVIACWHSRSLTPDQQMCSNAVLGTGCSHSRCVSTLQTATCQLQATKNVSWQQVPKRSPDWSAGCGSLTKSVQPAAFTSGSNPSSLRSLLPPRTGCSKSSCTTIRSPAGKVSRRSCGMQTRVMDEVLTSVNC